MLKVAQSRVGVETTCAELQGIVASRKSPKPAEVLLEKYLDFMKFLSAPLAPSIRVLHAQAMRMMLVHARVRVLAVMVLPSVVVAATAHGPKQDTPTVRVRLTRPACLLISHVLLSLRRRRSADHAATT